MKFALLFLAAAAAVYAAPTGDVTEGGSCTSGYACSGDNVAICANNQWTFIACPSGLVCLDGSYVCGYPTGGSSATQSSCLSSPSALKNQASTTSGANASATTSMPVASTVGANATSQSGNMNTTNTTSSAASSGSVYVTEQQFDDAVTGNGYAQPTSEQYQAFIQGIPKGDISSNEELAMFLAEILWESGGLQDMQELDCVSTGCPGQYDDGTGAPGQNYYGRGYIQLSWASNYAAASQALYGNSSYLVDDPNIVATDQTAAWGVSFWYWATRVHGAAGVQQGEFGAATNAINGGLECGSNDPTTAEKRFALYQEVLKAFDLDVTANPAGCYS